MSTLEVNTITPQSGTTLTLGGSGDTIQIASGASGLATTNGITEADQWRITTSTTHGENFLVSNWERNDTSFSLIGTGMTQSSGVFTFPSTGIYKVDWSLNFRIVSNVRVNLAGGYISATTDNSSYFKLAEGYNSVLNVAEDRYLSAHMSAIFDVTDTSTHKVKFASNATHIDTITQGTSSVNYTYATFIRLGDT